MDATKRSVHDVDALKVPITEMRSNSSECDGKVDLAESHDKHGIDMHAVPAGMDEAYERKVAIMNQALVDLGMGSFQWRVFAMTGFGWFVDNVSPSPKIYLPK
jgi:hypothetical protein